MKTTEGTLTIRDAAGRFEKHDVCECCGKPIKGEYLSDYNLANDGLGLLLCDRKRCEAKRDAMTVEDRRAMYTANRTARKAV